MNNKIGVLRLSGLTPKQEKFAQEVASGQSLADAYRAAFSVRPSTKPESIWQAASKLMANPKVSPRVDELRQVAAQNAVLTLEGHLDDLKALRDAAVSSGQLSAAISAEIARGKAAGVHVERSAVTVTTKELPASVDDFC
ncbi:MAG: terminase [Actinobacteria bacterium]|nr:terminase [Actinomycetota bacterium]